MTDDEFEAQIQTLREKMQPNGLNLHSKASRDDWGWGDFSYQVEAIVRIYIRTLIKTGSGPINPCPIYFGETKGVEPLIPILIIS